LGKIKILSEEVANRIAAGEVIERPASVVKECVENAIDANATEIIVKIVNGGRDLIQVIDNGHGMTEEDTFLAFERHATSKISNVDDIVHINTMGFRGEALPSIASVSLFQIITKTESDSIATEINFSGGRLDSMQKTAAKNGTTITVKNLFYNVPARRKFLKTEPIEYKHILNYIHYQSVLFPNISFVFYNNHKEKFNYPATGSIHSRMLDIFGTSFNNQQFIYFSQEALIIRISGYLQDIDKYDQNSLLDAHYIFVNRRFISDKTVYSAIKAGYEPFLKKYRFFESGKLPNYILFIDINPEEIDVNVHPAKTEIRFRNNGAVYQFVKDAIYQSLHKHELKRYEETKIKISSVPLTAPLTPKQEWIAKEIWSRGGESTSASPT
jgi:DNA mismatch repair protein MutL